MSFGQGIVIFLLAVLALVAEFVLFFLFALGSPEMAEQVLRMDYSVFWFIWLISTTSSVGLGAPIWAGVSWILQKAFEAERQVNTGREPCPFCAELIQPAAKVCRFCGRELEASAAN